jgi:hypothetical protein
MITEIIEKQAGNGKKTGNPGRSSGYQTRSMEAFTKANMPRPLIQGRELYNTLKREQPQSVRKRLLFNGLH